MLRVLFAGSPDCAVPALQSAARSHIIVGVLTNPAAPAGRSKRLVPTPVAQAAEELRQAGLIPAGTPVLTPDRVAGPVLDAIAAAKPDILACFAYGKMFGPKTLALFSLGALNIHPSLLPRWRGATPIQAAILAGDKETGITIQKMGLEMDAGDIILQKKISLNGTETAGSLLDTAAREGADLLSEALRLCESGTLNPEPQDSSLATYAPPLKKEDGLLRWTDTAEKLDARIRAFYPWPGTFTPAGENILLIHRAHVYRKNAGPDKTAVPGFVLGTDPNDGILIQTGGGILAVEQLQWRGKKNNDWKSFMNGTRNFENTILGSGSSV
ncbi:methionyl-tRNA formyltransferase [Brucepastera parasyntrophica]|uniref:methionyl-tRNA formyltransferase n=1 Tax=Brucepastera parasyntrophica TaxID=2880008 RepID=UPI00210A34E3|nr:methionyl-tRNA formyltransferase [Brucepastera parasyntrophica]ULQ59203.1 methionyl-tRNA formyltransferase [Brucepastera parasyntrophica]